MEDVAMAIIWVFSGIMAFIVTAAYINSTKPRKRK
jgi:hypothetical protein